VDELNKKRTIAGTSGKAMDAKQRRIGLVVHDDRGQASLEWRDAPVGYDHDRPVLEVLDAPQLSLAPDDNGDPYARHTATLPKTGPGNTTRTDLRKLSEWIKLKRELEAKKLRGED
jgi:hypothetical protein